MIQMETSIRIKRMIKELINLANHLDSNGLKKEADVIDNIIKMSSDAGSASVTFRFARGESDIDIDATIKAFPDMEKDLEKVRILINKGIQDESEPGFINIEVGTSATGSTGDNKDVLVARVKSAMNLIADELNTGSRLPDGPAPHPGSVLSQPYSAEELLSKSRFSPNVSTVGKGGHIGPNIAPDKDSPYWDQYQFVKVTVTPKEKPDVRDAASEMRGALDNILPNYIEAPFADGALPMVSLTHILEGLRGREDFIEFDEEFTAQYGMCFHQAACEGTINFKGRSFTIPWPLPPFKKQVRIPAVNLLLEIGENSEGINSILKNLDVPPVKCSKPVKCPNLK